MLSHISVTKVATQRLVYRLKLLSRYPIELEHIASERDCRGDLSSRSGALTLEALEDPVPLRSTVVFYMSRADYSLRYKGASMDWQKVLISPQRGRGDYIRAREEETGRGISCPAEQRGSSIDSNGGEAFASAADRFGTYKAKRPQWCRSDPETSEHVLCEASYEGSLLEFVRMGLFRTIATWFGGA